MTTNAAAPEFLVLHAVRVKGFANTSAVAETAGLDADVVSRQLLVLEEAGHLSHLEGRISGWRTTAKGKVLHAQLIAENVREAECLLDANNVYQRFLPLNEPFKELCTEWQLQGQPSSCVPKLAELHHEVIPTVIEMSTLFPWYRTYESRLADALKRLQAGDVESFTKPLSGSYHDVWMELHEDFLLTLGRKRSVADGS